MTTPPSEQGAAAPTDLLAEAQSEGYDGVAEYVHALKQHVNGYRTERNSARDAYRRHRDESAYRGGLINAALGLLNAPAGANLLHEIAKLAAEPVLRPDEDELHSIERAADLLEQYSAFIAVHVTSADIELHPYPPEISGTAEDLRALAARATQGDRNGS